MPRKGIRNDWRRRTQCISWSTDEEKMVRYAMKELWPVPFVGTRNDTGRSLFVHSATAFFFMFLQWANENNVDVPIKFFEDLYGMHFDIDDKLIRLKQIYQGVVLDDKIKNPPGEPQTEAELRRQIRELFRDGSGWSIRDTSDNRKTRRQLKGMTDLQLRYNKWDRGLWMHFEVKFGAGSWHWSADDTGYSAQQEAYNAKEIQVWWWLVDAIQFKEEQERLYV